MANQDFPKDCGCVGDCGHQVVGTLGTNVPNPRYLGDILNGVAVKHNGIETNYVWKDKFKDGLAGILFDVEVKRYANNEMRHVYKLKQGLSRGGRKRVKISERNGCCAVIRYEGTSFSNKANVAVDAAAGDTVITLDSAADIGGVNANVSLLIKTPTRTLTVKIASVDPADPNTVTLVAPLKEDVPTTSCVMRGHYNPAAGCNEIYSDTVNMNSEDQEYVSYFTRIIKTLTFDSRCALNTSYLSDMLKGGTSEGKESAIYQILQTQFEQQMDAAFQELAYAMIRHKNFCPSGDEFGETMGLLPALAKVEEANPGSQFFDFSMCCDDTECEAIQAQKLIENFLNLVESRTQLNIYKSMNVVIAINDEQKQALLRMRQYFEMYSAIGVITTSQSPARSGDVISTRRKIFEIEHRGYNISFVEMEALNMIAGPQALLMPEDTMGIFTYVNDMVKVDNGGIRIMKNDQQLLTGDTLKLKIKEDENVYNDIDGCTTFNMRVYFAIVWMFVDKCAYAMISNFALCTPVTDCITCDTPSEVPFC